MGLGFIKRKCDEFIVGDLRDPKVVSESIDEGMDEVYQLAADMGGAGYIFTGDNDANVMHNSALINLQYKYYSKRAIKGQPFPMSLQQGSRQLPKAQERCLYPDNLCTIRRPS